MVPMKGLALEHEGHDDGEHHQRHHLLNDLELDEVERPAIVNNAKAVGRHLAHILKQGDAPRKKDDRYQGPILANARLLQLEMPVPGKGHKYVGADKQ